MLFNSVHFLVFFPFVVLVYFVIPKKVKYIWLLLMSYAFYMCWNAKYALLLFGSTAVTWIGGRAIASLEKKREKLAVVWTVLGINLAILFFFKYFDFFLDNLNRVLGKAGIQILENRFDILLPVGISFYIFQSLSYTIDVYKKEIEPERNFLRYALFVSFFPQLVAGPIERSGNLLNQMKKLDRERLWNFRGIVEGGIMMAWGMFVKMVIADRVAILVKSVFEGYFLHGTFALCVGAIGFALQIYCDFMGYSTIAIGSAKVMGFTLMENFDTPYFACSIGEFWRRWHISLSTWFRDYVYIPLGGSRCSKPRKYLNLMITMAVSGLWHGADWTYVAWGLLHGVYQVVGDMTRPFRQHLWKKTGAKTDSFSFRLGQMILTFAFVDLAWIFFRADSIGTAVRYIGRMVTRFDPWTLFDGTLYTLGLDRFEFSILWVALIALFLVDLLRYFKKMNLAVFLMEQCLWFRWLVVFGLIFACLVYGVYGIKFESSQFIYFQF